MSSKSFYRVKILPYNEMLKNPELHEEEAPFDTVCITDRHGTYLWNKSNEQVLNASRELVVYQAEDTKPEEQIFQNEQGFYAIYVLPWMIDKEFGIQKIN